MARSSLRDRLGSQNQTAGVLDGRGMFLLSLIAVCAVAVVDIAAGSRVTLVGLLAIGPVIATFGSTPAQTALVAALAVTLLIPLGLTVDDLSSSELLTRLVTVG